MNGPNPFMHPVSGRLIGSFEWYEGYGHQEHENGAVVESDTEAEALGTKTTRRRGKKEGGMMNEPL